MDDLRAMIEKLLNHGFSYKRILALASSNGHEIGISDDALGKFYRKKTKLLEGEHADALYRFFRTSPAAIALLSPNTNSGAHYFRLLAELAGGYGSSAQRSLTGTHWLYHASFLYPDQYVVRALSVTPIGDVAGAPVEFIDYMADRRDAQHPAVYESSGALVYTNARAQFISHNADNGLGVRLMICEEVFPVRVGVTDAIIARMFGLGNDAKPYHRYALLVRSKQSFAKMKAETGVFTWPELAPAHKAAFDLLKKKRQRFDDAVPDPLAPT